MALGLGWKPVEAGRISSGGVVAPDERLPWGRTIGLGAQHVVAMFGATFVFPLLMGLNPQLAIMMSGIATIIFLLLTAGRVPSYLGSSASFVGAAAAIKASGAPLSALTGATLVAGLVLAAVGVAIHVLGTDFLQKALPPVVTGAVVMLIGFNLASVVAQVYWPQDQWVALATMLFVIVVTVRFQGFIGRISIFLALIFGYLLSWLLDRTTGQLTSYDAAAGKVTTHFRTNFDGVAAQPWFGLPPSTGALGPDGKPLVGLHAPTFSLAAILVVLPIVIALIAENTGHVKAVAEMTGHDLDPMMGRAIAADGVGTMVASAVGGAPTTTYAENIGVMAATRVYSTAAYYVAALVAILFGFSPKFGALVSSVPGGVLGGITVVLYGMIGLLGAKIWKENGVDFGNPINLVPIAAGVIIGVGGTSLKLGDSFDLGGIALGTIVAILAYHLARAIAPADLLTPHDDAAAIVVGHGIYGHADGVDDLYHEGYPGPSRQH